jgi:hypothetical protein
VVRGQALLQRSRPAKPSKPRRILEVIEVGAIPAAGADDLVHVVAAAVDPAIHDAGRLAPQERPSAVAGLCPAGGGMVPPSSLGPVTMSETPELLTQLTTRR